MGYLKSYPNFTNCRDCQLPDLKLHRQLPETDRSTDSGTANCCTAVSPGSAQTRLNSSEILRDLLVEVRRTASEHMMFAQKVLIGDAVYFRSRVNE